MSKQQEQLTELREIRQLMERSSRFLSLSGLAGVIIGIFAIAGVVAAYSYLGISPFERGYYVQATEMDGSPNASFICFFFADALTVLGLSLLAGALMARSKARKLNQAFWDATAKRMLINMLLPLVAGGLFCLILLYHGRFEFIPSATLLFYGLALVNASKYTIDDIRYLGMVIVAAGLGAAWFLDYGLLFWAFGFGLLHMVYGMVIYLKYEK